MKNLMRLLCALLAIAIMPSCASNIEPEQPIPPQHNVAERTILVYMVANNSLGSGGYDLNDLYEMQQAAIKGHLGNGRLLAYDAPYGGSAPVLMEVKASGFDTLRTYPKDALSVSIAQMRTVIDDAKAFAPANDYGIILWSHALGWLQDGIADTPQAMERSFGLDAGKKMNVTSLADALYGQDFSFVYFDCCFMGSVEVMYQLRNVTPIIAGSPAEDPIDGMPYHKALKPLFAPGQADVVAAADSTFTHYMANYVKGDCPVTLSVVNTAALDRLAMASRDIYLHADRPVPVGYDPQPMAEPALCYYYDFGDYVEALAGYDDSKLQPWRDALAQAIIYKANSPWIWSSIQITRYSGLSTYLLRKEAYANSKGYKELDWYSDVAASIFETAPEAAE